MGTYDGTLYRGTAAYSAGQFSNAISGAVIAVPDIPSSAVGTIEMWVKSTANTTRVAFGSAATGSIWIGTNGGKAAFQPVGASGNTASTITISDGVWHHLAMVVNGTNQILYVDGVQGASVANTNPMTIGTAAAVAGFQSVNTYDWTGLIDELRISNNVRYTGNFTVPTTVFADDANTVALYHFDSNFADYHGGAPAQTSTTIVPTDSNILYSPYNWLVGSGVAQTINAGAYFRCVLTGSPTAISLGFNLASVSTPLPQVAYRIDGSQWVSQEIASSITINIPSTNTWSKHLVEVRVKSTSETVNRWNSPQNTAVKFTGVTVSPNTVVTTPVRRRRFNILAFGDSITEGVRTLNQTASNDTDRNDSSLAWSYPLTDAVGAEIGVVGFGATGYTVPGSGNVPAIGSTYNMLWASQARTFTPNPDLIVIHLGTNDGTTDTTGAVTGVLNGLLSATPVTTKIVLVQPWKGTQQAANLKAGRLACTAPARVSFVDTTGWWVTGDASDALHPYGYVNLTDLVPRLADQLRTILGIGAQFRNVAGTATPLTTVIR